MAESFDPYHRWLGIPPKQQPANLYRLLGIELFESEVEVIRDAAEQRMAHVRTYQLGPNSELSQKILNELAAAKACLLDAAGKAAYDASLRATLAGSPPGMTGSSPPARDLSDLLADAEKEAPSLPEPAGLARRRRKWLPTGRKGIPTSRAMPRPSDRYSARWPRSLWALLGVPATAVILVLVLLLWFSGNARDILRAMGLAFQETDMASQPPDPGSRSPQPTPEPPAPEPSAPPSPSPSAAPPPAVAPFDAQKAREHQEAWAKHLGVPVETTNSIGMKLVLIPPGEFDMGSTQEEVEQLLKRAKEGNYPSWYVPNLPREAPRHRVRLTKPFCLATCEVTTGVFRKFVEEAAYKTDAEEDGKGSYGLDKSGVYRRSPEFVWHNPGFVQTESHPVVDVSWNDATALCEWLSRKESKEYRLPTEAEWEYACRAGSASSYHFGDDATSLGEYAWYASNSGDGTHPVGEKKPNAWGVHDMHGNVWEWCSDWFAAEYYAESPANDPVGPASGTSRVLRGGSWDQWAYPDFLRCAYRFKCGSDERWNHIGFRVAMAPPSPKPERAGKSPVSPEPEGKTASATPASPPVPASKPMPAPVPVPTPASPPAVAPDDEAKANQRKSAEQLGVPITLTNTIGMKFVLIPPGEFLMGSPDDDRHGSAEKPQHRVRITKPFYLGVYEVTQLEFARMMRANPSNFKGNMKRPVEQVTWNDAVEFCRRLSAKERVRYRLPTEAEWEYACRAGSTTRYCFGDSESELGEFAWYSDNSGKTTHPVGQKKPNAWGLFDMHGNVWEWCADWYGTNYYRASPAADPTGPTTGSGRVSRGGGFDPAAGYCRSAKRGDLFLVNGVYLALGFRVVRAAE